MRIKIYELKNLKNLEQRFELALGKQETRLVDKIFDALRHPWLTPFLSGGAAESVLFDPERKLKDLDFFIPHDPEDYETVEDVIDNFKNEMKILELTSDRTVPGGYQILSFRNNDRSKIPVQLIFVPWDKDLVDVRLKDRAHIIFKSFDFHSSMVAFYRTDLKSYKCYVDKLGIQSNRKKFLLLNESDSLSPRASLMRIIKKQKDGWYVNFAIHQMVSYLDKSKGVLEEKTTILSSLDDTFCVSDDGIKLPSSFKATMGDDDSGYSCSNSNVETFDDDDDVWEAPF